MQHARQRGFTLVELLVVIAIIGILVALLLPAVQSARESGRRIQCANNLKQLSLACQLHVDSHGRLPWGVSDGPIQDCCNATERTGWSWLFQITPYIEQNNVHDNPTDSLVNATVISTFYCPTRRKPDRYNNGGRCDYAGNAGSVMDGTSKIGQDGVFVRQWKTLPLPAGTAPNQIRYLADITDGLSQTLLASEKQLHWTVWGTAGGDNEVWNNCGWDQDTLRVGGEIPQPDRLHPDKNQPTFWSMKFGSSHPAGLNYTRVDGSVGFAVFNIEPVVWSRFSSINDGVALPGTF